MNSASQAPDHALLLLRQIALGDGHALRRLHEQTARRLLPFALRIVGSRDVADEVLQESFIAIWRDALRYDCTRAAPMTWMIAIVRNKAIDSLRANALRERLTDHDALPNCCDPALGPCEIAELGQRARLVRDGLRRLDAMPRRAIELAYFEDLTHGEVARRMIIPLGSAKTLIRRGCLQMRRQLERSAQRAGGALTAA